MISSLRKVIKDSVDGYRKTERNRWVLDWPGQVVLCTSSIFWTEEVTQAMKEEDGIEVNLHESRVKGHESQNLQWFALVYFRNIS